MLETRNLCKIYKPKKGVPVRALDGVTLRFPDTGMVFLLGKSGSGKSTLLNLLGGLDRYDSGDIIIKGVSSGDFKQQHFDSYRNTYVGFIFQEYNVLDDFNVGANIALAIELQGRRAEDSEINAILREVDLEGYGARRPNELSGGQKQRVAIARALVKNPEIIMADEPTGALDSNTGKQVFDTLKKLSANKLVIVVSHDREFAEQYADRIIELADGRVIGDVECVGKETEPEAQGITYEEDSISLAPGYQLTEEDREAINEYIRASADRKHAIRLRKNSGKNFVQTDESVIGPRTGGDFKLIKSRLPMKSAFRMGASGLRFKKLRLAFTIILSVIAFSLFAFVDTFSSYDLISSCTNSLIDTGVRYASASKEIKRTSFSGNTYYSSGYYLTQEEIDYIEENTGVHMKGVYSPIRANMSLYGYFDTSIELSETNYNVYASAFTGFSEITQSDLDQMGYSLVCGTLPDGSKNEIAISKYLCETFIKAGYANIAALKEDELPKDELPTYEKIFSYSDMLGKRFTVAGAEYTVTGVVDTLFDLDRYMPLMTADESDSTADMLLDFALANEFNYERMYSLGSVAIVGEGAVSRMLENTPNISYISEGSFYFMINSDQSSNYISFWTDFATRLSDINESDVLWIDGKAPSALGEHDIIVTADMILNLGDAEYFDGNNWVVAFPSDEIAELPESDEELIGFVKEKLGDITLSYNNYYENDYGTEAGYKIVGVIKNEGKYKDIYNLMVCSDSLFKRCTGESTGLYYNAVGAMPSSRSDVYRLVDFAYSDADIRYTLNNSVTFELVTVDEVLDVLSSVFLWIGVGFAVFAALMLSNFIGTSITHKKQEIGILRAIGSRSNDVFRIFFSESFIIAMINFLLAGVVTFSVTALINSIIRRYTGILITVLDFGPRQLLMLFVVSVAVAAVASFLPVYKIASKRPIDAIRDR